MVPVVQANEESHNKRKGKTVIWKELKLCLAHSVGSNDPFFGGTFSGGVDKAGYQLHHCAKLAGFGEKTKLHAVDDGAKWIADQIEEQFGAKGSYLIDFFHLCDYLSEASLQNEEVEGEWYKEQKALLKSGKAEHAGAWWKSENIDYMLSLQLNRANKFWDNSTGIIWQQ